MTKFFDKKNILKYILICIILLLMLLIIVMPKISINSFWQGLIIWATNVLPAMLPYFILTKLLSYTQLTSKIGLFFSPITHKLYGVGGVAGYISIMSIISGYPVGAKITSELYQDGIITSGQAKTIASFTSTSGPLFIIGTVGIGLFNSSQLGIIILISHFLGAIINGLFYRYNGNDTQYKLHTQQSNNSNILSDSMYSSITSILIVGGFIALFYMILQCLLHLNIFKIITSPLNKLGIKEGITNGIISGLIEVTSGAIMLSKCNLSFKIITPILTFLISFGGLSIHAQALCFLQSFKMKYSEFLLQKTTHAIISSLLATIIVLIT